MVFPWCLKSSQLMASAIDWMNCLSQGWLMPWRKLPATRPQVCWCTIFPISSSTVRKLRSTVSDRQEVLAGWFWGKFWSPRSWFKLLWTSHTMMFLLAGRLGPEVFGHQVCEGARSCVQLHVQKTPLCWPRDFPPWIPSELASLASSNFSQWPIQLASCFKLCCGLGMTGELSELFPSLLNPLIDGRPFFLSFHPFLQCWGPQSWSSMLPCGHPVVFSECFELSVYGQ